MSLDACGLLAIAHGRRAREPKCAHRYIRFWVKVKGDTLAADAYCADCGASVPEHSCPRLDRVPRG